MIHENISSEVIEMERQEQKKKRPIEGQARIRQQLSNTKGEG